MRAASVTKLFPLLVVNFIGTVGFSLVLPFLVFLVTDLPLVVLILARAMDGLTGGNVSIANAYVADITSEDQRATSFGQMAVSSNLGFVLGPAMAGMLGATAWGALLPVMAAAAISLLVTLFSSLRSWGCSWSLFKVPSTGAGSLGAVASVIGLILGGMLFATFGPKVFWVSAAVTFMVALVGVTSSGGRPRP